MHRGQRCPPLPTLFFPHLHVTSYPCPHVTSYSSPPTSGLPISFSLNLLHFPLGFAYFPYLCLFFWQWYPTITLFVFMCFLLHSLSWISWLSEVFSFSSTSTAIRSSFALEIVFLTLVLKSTISVFFWLLGFSPVELTVYDAGSSSLASIQGQLGCFDGRWWQVSAPCLELVTQITHSFSQPYLLHQMPG